MRAGPNSVASIEGIARELRLDLTASQVDTLDRFVALLQRWNSVYNLTAHRDPDRIVSHHIADCLAAVGPLQRQTRCFKSHRLLDVGSGGGLPGVVIAVAMAQWEVCCVDAVGKKAAFTTQAAVALGLPNLNSIHARVETIAGAYDVVCSRAFASLSDFARVTRHTLADSGVWMAMKGRRPDAELTDVHAAVDVFHVEQLTVPRLAEERCLVWMRKRRP